MLSQNSFFYYFINTHVSLLLNISDLIHKLPLLLFTHIANHVCLAHIKHLFGKIIDMYMDNRKECGDKLVYLAEIKLASL